MLYRLTSVAAEFAKVMTAMAVAIAGVTLVCVIVQSMFMAIDVPIAVIIGGGLAMFGGSQLTYFVLFGEG